jgi:hypothetical protein
MRFRLLRPTALSKEASFRLLVFCPNYRIPRQPFKWTAKDDAILEKSARARQDLMEVAAGTN